MSETNRIQVNRSNDDSFRARIANAISKSVEENPGGDVSDLADAVIAALGLETERRVGPGEPGEGLSGFIRYEAARARRERAQKGAAARSGWEVDE